MHLFTFADVYSFIQHYFVLYLVCVINGKGRSEMKRKVGSFLKIVGGIYLIYLGAAMAQQMQGREGRGDTWHGVPPSAFILVGVLFVVVYLWILLNPIKLYAKTSIKIKKKIARMQAERIRIQEFVEDDSSEEVEAEGEPVREETMSEKIQQLRKQPHKGVIGGLATDLLELTPQEDEAGTDENTDTITGEEKAKATGDEKKAKRREGAKAKKDKEKNTESKPRPKDEKKRETESKARVKGEKAKDTKGKTESTKDRKNNTKDKIKDSGDKIKNKEVEVIEINDKESKIKEMDTKEIKPKKIKEKESEEKK